MFPATMIEERYTCPECAVSVYGSIFVAGVGIQRNMHQHTHTGVIMFVYVTAAAIVGLNLVRIGAAMLTNNPKTETVGKALGSLVHFA